MIRYPITITKSKMQKQKFLHLLCLVIVAAIFGCVQGKLWAADSAYGFVFERFKLTLEEGYRTEAAGPFFYSEHLESNTTWAWPPFYSCNRDTAIPAHEDDYFYPLLTHIHYGLENRWQLFQLLSFAGGQEPDETQVKRFTVFPFYFQQRAAEPKLNYTAVFPFYGHLNNRLFHDEMDFVMFPIYSETRKRDVITDNYVYPFVHVRHGEGLNGWQVWPIVGHEHKEVTQATNGFGDISLVAGHDKRFFLWPLHLKQDTGIGTENPEKFRATFPFYAYSRSPQRDYTSVIWPFFAWIDDREKKYHEWEGPYPFVIFTRGEGKHTSRIWPLFSQSHNLVKQSDSYVWPLYTYRRTHSDPLDQHTARFALFLFVNSEEKNTQTSAAKKRIDVWPLFTWHRDFNGNERLQILAPLEPAVPNNRGIERNWSPLWSLWRAETNLKTQSASQSLFWNLYRRETAPDHKKFSLLFGLFQYQSDKETRRSRWFYVNFPSTSAK